MLFFIQISWLTRHLALPADKFDGDRPAGASPPESSTLYKKMKNTKWKTSF